MSNNFCRFKRWRHIFICVVVCCAGCTSSAEKDFRQFQSEAMHLIDPLKLQEWAISVAEKHELYYQVATEDLPVRIKNFHPQACPTAFVVEGDAPERKLLMIVWGGRIKHQGLIIGDKDYKGIPAGGPQMIMWTAGVYFWQGSE